MLRKPQEQRPKPGNAKRRPANANSLKQPESAIGAGRPAEPTLKTNDVLCSILGMMRQQAEYLDRQHGWLVAVSETIEKHPDLVAELKNHPFHNQGPREDRQITNTMISNIDALLRQLRS